MLKLKKEYGFEDLKKMGFVDDEGEWSFILKDSPDYIKTCISIIPYSHELCFWDSFDPPKDITKIRDEKLFDLINSGMIEKVED